MAHKLHKGKPPHSSDSLLYMDETTIVRRERHADIFTPAEAVIYLGLESERSLETVRNTYGLIGFRVGKYYLYHRDDLNACALRMFGREQAKGAK